MFIVLVGSKGTEYDEAKVIYFQLDGRKMSESTY